MHIDDLRQIARQTRTSDLICYLNPDVLIDAFEHHGITDGDVKTFLQVIADEIDRRIPIPE